MWTFVITINRIHYLLIVQTAASIAFAIASEACDLDQQDAHRMALVLATAEPLIVQCIIPTRIFRNI